MRPAAADGGPLGGTAAALARRRALLGLVFLAGYVLPLFAPPGPRPLLPPTPDAMLLERLFPGVPAWWVVARLVCLIIGAVLIAGAGDGPVPVHLIRASRHTQSRRSASSRSATVAALLVALAHALMSRQAGQLTQPQQVGYFAMLGVPTALLWLSARWGRFRTASRRSPRRWGLGRTVLPVGAVLLLWCAIRIPAAMHSPRAATPIDFWLNFQWLIELVTQNRNVLTSSSEPGVPNTYMLFVGAPLLGAGRIAPSLTWVQAFHVVWILGTAATLALLVSLVVGRTAAALAAATLLFSPLVLMFHLEPAPLGLLTLLTVALVLLTRQIYIDASVTALAALGAVAGVSAAFAHLTHLALSACLATAVRAFRKPRLPWPGLVIAAATFVAATVPALPRPAALRAMVTTRIQRNWQWAGAEAVLLGQRSARRRPDIAALMQAGQARPYDVVFGGLLLPFMVPRTAMRLCGDAAFEPIGAALAAVGLAACVRRPRRRGTAAMLVFYGLALLPAAATTASDRVSLTRSIAVPVAVALLAAVGFQTLRRALLSRRRAGVAAAVAASILSGAVLFDVVTPRVIAASSLDVILRALRNVPDPDDVALLEQVEPYPPQGWLHERRIATFLPAKPLSSWRFEGPQSVDRPGGGRAPKLYVWSPALEEDAQVSRTICARWPAARLYILQDRAALSRAFAASPTDAGWRPALPDTQWSVGGCDALAGRLQSRF